MAESFRADTTLARVTRWLYPPQCCLCGALTADDGHLCGSCWRDMPFLTGLGCDACGASLPGARDDGVHFCDDCMTMARPWSRGRAALSYRDRGRHVVLALKHGDRLDLTRPAAAWMATAGRDLLKEAALLLPVPIARGRLFRRKYNQAAELSRALSRVTGVACCPDALERTQATRPQDGMDIAARFRNVENVIRVAPDRMERVKGGKIVLIDDVMTSGATLSACAGPLIEAGAVTVDVLVLARVEKTP